MSQGGSDDIQSTNQTGKYWIGRNEAGLQPNRFIMRMPIRICVVLH